MHITAEAFSLIQESFGLVRDILYASRITYIKRNVGFEGSEKLLLTAYS